MPNAHLNLAAKFVLLVVMGLGLANCRYLPSSRSGAGTTASPAPAKANQKGVVAERVKDANGVSFDVVTLDPKQRDLKILYLASNGERLGSLANVETAASAEGKQLLLATNGGMYGPDHAAAGLLIVDGKELKSINTRDGEGNFHLKPNGVFALTNKGAVVMETAAFIKFRQTKGTKISYATQSGPLLVGNGKFNVNFQKDSDNKLIRSGVGVTKAGKVVIAISNDDVSFYDFASLFRDKYGCPNALFLDGNVSRLYAPALDRTDRGGDFAGIITVME